MIQLQELGVGNGAGARVEYPESQVCTLLRYYDVLDRILVPTPRVSDHYPGTPLHFLKTYHDNVTQVIFIILHYWQAWQNESVSDLYTVKIRSKQ